MKHIPALLGAALAIGLFGTPQTARAQVVMPLQGPNQTPIFSPFLNLNRFGNPAINYFGVIQPQLAQQNQLFNLQQQQLQQQQQLGLISQLGAAPGDIVPGANAVSMTGHSATFFNYSHYFGQAGGNYAPMLPPPGTTGLRR
jgi:hypothetical protein